jgi:RNA polymerase subunit RPABC4/transcription elongation factor Spt4
MPAYTVCRDPKCGTLVEGKVAACPKCGGAMRTVGESPWRGIVLLLCGLFLTIGMGVILSNMYPTLSNPGVRMPDGSSFTGTADQARITILLFAAVIAFGLVATANGVYMLITKQQSKVFMFVSLGFAAALLIITFVAMGKLKDSDTDEPKRTYSTY